VLGERRDSRDFKIFIDDMKLKDMSFLGRNLYV